jgi:hypothetical protein
MRVFGYEPHARAPVIAEQQTCVGRRGYSSAELADLAGEGRQARFHHIAIAPCHQPFCKDSRANWILLNDWQSGTLRKSGAGRGHRAVTHTPPVSLRLMFEAEQSSRAATSSLIRCAGLRSRRSWNARGRPPSIWLASPSLGRPCH